MLAVDDPGVLAALTDLIDGEPGMTVVGAARDANEAVLVAEQATPDVALVDVQMPGGGGARATRELILRSPRTGVVAVSAHGARSVVAEMLRAGAMGFVVKGAPIAEIVDAVRRTARGQGSLSGELTATLGLELDEHLGRRDRANAARREQIARVRRALEPGAIRPIFQPIVELGDGSVVGYEALARFHLDPVNLPIAGSTRRVTWASPRTWSSQQSGRHWSGSTTSDGGPTCLSICRQRPCSRGA